MKPPGYDGRNIAKKGTGDIKMKSPPRNTELSAEDEK